MSGYKVSIVDKGQLTIVNSESKIICGTLSDDFFIRDDGKKAKYIGALKTGFKRSFLKNSEGCDYVYKENESDSILYSVLNAIEKRDSKEIRAEDYIVLSDWG